MDLRLKERSEPKEPFEDLTFVNLLSAVDDVETLPDVLGVAIDCCVTVPLVWTERMVYGPVLLQLPIFNMLWMPVAVVLGMAAFNNCSKVAISI
jgi:hypothetical protein